ncbi:MAG: hypothetical protein GTO60_03295, partial [Gammaproteobacteria bacterium]|nr:hypothetical protein [Gammaproteobacteria bacterium]NIO62442.1 hypothetical protein [Gammaproteobacteria bacterium]
MHTLKSIASHKHIIMKSATKACLLISIFTAAICLSACERSVDPQEVSRVMLPAEHELTIRSSPTLALSPDGDMLVYRADTGEDDIRQLYLYSLIENRGRILEGTRDGETPFFSPDGDRIGFFA